jgi:hypothetical protein
MRSAPPRREITAIDRALCRVVGIARGQLQFAICMHTIDEFAKRFCPIRIESITAAKAASTKFFKRCVGVAPQNNLNI